MICPTCKKFKAIEEYFPFCCKKCKDVDLYNWLTGQYSIPTEEKLNEEAEIREED